MQNWRFVYATRDSPKWDQYLDSLWALNRLWAKNAGVLVVAMSRKSYVRKGKVELVPTHSFEAGSAWMCMALEGTARGLVVHAMSGFYKDKIANVIGLNGNDNYEIEAMIAIGNRAPPGYFSGLMDKVTTRNAIETFISKETFQESEGSSETIK